MAFNENTRVKIPAILHLTQLGYEYVSLKDAKWDADTNIFTDIFTESIRRINAMPNPPRVVMAKKKRKPKTTGTLHIENGFVNDALARWGNAKNHLEKIKSVDVPKAQVKEHEAQISEFETEIETAKIGLMDSNMIFGKKVDGVAVKINPDYSQNKK